MDQPDHSTTNRAPTRRGLLGSAAIALVFLLGLAAARHWTPLSHWIDFETVAIWAQSIKDNSAAPYLIVAAYLLGGLTFFPVTLLTAVTILTFGPLLGNAYALIGWISSAILGYAIGAALGRDLLQKIAGSRLERLNLDNRRNGLLAVLAARVLPIAPFMLVNLIIGASRIRLRDFILGSLIGRIPGIFVLTLFGYQAVGVLRTPATGKFAVMAALLLLVIMAQRWIGRQVGELATIEKSMPSDVNKL